MTLRDLFDIAADAFEEGRIGDRDTILASLDPAVAAWYWVIGPERGRETVRVGLPDPIFGFTKMIFPILRRIVPSLIANELVSVQPMSLPSGLLFYMDYRYDNTKTESDQISPSPSLLEEAKKTYVAGKKTDHPVIKLKRLPKP